MTTDTTTLTDFLLARIADDEEMARRALMLRDVRETRDDEPWRLWWQDVPSRLIIDPSRVLAECEAKRRIMERHGPELGADSCDEWEREWPCSAIRAIASVYSDHPDYRADWA